jgi:hypothetical protein
MTTSAIMYDEIHANSLLASTFKHPSEVLANPFLDKLQKRCVLATWASDAFAVEGKPWLRQIPGSNEAVRIGDILAALRSLDDDDCPPPKASRLALPGNSIRVRAVGQTAKEQRRRHLAEIHP